jgi:DNA-binding GntR family transcriptional regulator
VIVSLLWLLPRVLDACVEADVLPATAIADRAFHATIFTFCGRARLEGVRERGEGRNLLAVD